MRDQFVEPDGFQQACGDTAGKGRAEARQHRHAAPKRVACRRMRVAWDCVQEQIAEMNTGKVLLKFHARRENDAILPDVALFGFIEKPAPYRTVPLQQPKNAAGNLGQQPHPKAENFRAKLVLIVETAKHESRPGQTALVACGRSTGGSWPVIWLV